MPNYLSQSYGDITATQGLGQSLSMARRAHQIAPLLQMQLALRQQALQNQAMLNQAHAELFRAQTERQGTASLLDTTRAQKIKHDQELAAKLGAAMSSATPVDYSQGPTLQAGRQLANADIANYASQLAAGSPGRLGVNIAQLQQGAADPSMQAMIATGTRLPTQEPRMTVLGPGYMGVSQSGQVLAQNPMMRPSASMSSPELRHADQVNRYVTDVQNSRGKALAAADPSQWPLINKAFDSLLSGTNMLIQAQGPATVLPPQVGTNMPPAAAANNDPLGLFK